MLTLEEYSNTNICQYDYISSGYCPSLPAKTAIAVFNELWDTTNYPKFVFINLKT